MIVDDSWWSNGSGSSTIIDYYAPLDQGFKPFPAKFSDGFNGP